MAAIENEADRPSPERILECGSSCRPVGGLSLRHQLALLVTLVALVLVGCRESSPRSLSVSDAYGQIVGEDLYVVPSADWRLTEEGQWEFYSRGQFLVHVTRSPRRSLRIELTVAPDSRDYRPSVRWEGRPLGNQALTFSDRFVVTVPPGELTPGTHRLIVKRDYVWDSVNAPNSQLKTHFDAVSYGTGGMDRPPESWDPLRMQRYRYLREFLAGGVTGATREVRGGVLFDGPGKLRLTAERAGTLEMVVENLSSLPASLGLTSLKPTVEANARREDLPVGGRRAIQIPVANGVEVELSVADADGLVLVGGLYLVSEPPDPPPSIIVITLDTTRRDFVAPYDPEAVTPNLADFASAATVFEQAVATS
ncbi:MAG: hypothetical protein K8J08_08625, partial [Thermoanaerobaculia bacterium]|nr:hypothetical protein [Thermoanaerobaculia bacterium]